MSMMACFAIFINLTFQSKALTQLSLLANVHISEIYLLAQIPAIISSKFKGECDIIRSARQLYLLCGNRRGLASQLFNLKFDCFYSFLDFYYSYCLSRDVHVDALFVCLSFSFLIKNEDKIKLK